MFWKGIGALGMGQPNCLIAPAQLQALSNQIMVSQVRQQGLYTSMQTHGTGKVTQEKPASLRDEIQIEVDEWLKDID